MAADPLRRRQGRHLRARQLDPADDVEGLAPGRKVADYSWPKYQAYLDGTAPAPKPAAEPKGAAKRKGAAKPKRAASPK